MVKLGSYTRESPNSKVWWLANYDVDGEFVISFDKKHNLNLFADYPYKFTKEQKEIFDKEYPFWADFFKWRTNDG